MQKPVTTLLLFAICLHNLYAQFPVETRGDTGKKGVVNPLTGEEIVAFEYDEINVVVGDSVYQVKKGGKFGVVDNHNRVLIPFQFGMISFTRGANDQPYRFARVYNDAGEKNKWGLINRKGEQVLPMQYEELRVVYPDLIYGKTWRDTVLHFFDAAGKLLYQVPGRSAGVGFDNNTVEISRDRSKDRSFHVQKSNGKPYYDGRYTNLVFTDGKVVVYGMQGKLGIITLDGDTILPFVYSKISPFPDGNFLVSTAGDIHALVNSAGNILVPPAMQKIQKWKNHPDAVYTVQQKSKSTVTLIDVRGKVLVENCSVYPGADWRNKNEETQWDYLKVGTENNTKQGFFRSDGKQILPFEFSDIQYFTPKYPLIVRRQLPGEGNKSRMEVYDLEGKKLLPGDYPALRFTNNPHVLLGMQDSTQKWGIIRPAFPEAATFVYNQFNILHTGYYAVNSDFGGWHLLDRNFRKVEWKTKRFDHIIEPTRPYYDLFRKQKMPGKLVAVGYRTGAGNPFAINDYGLVFEFEPLRPPSVMQETPGGGKVEVEAVEAVVAPEMVVEAPQPRVFENVEQMPQFPGGDTALQEFIKKNLNYPAIARQNHIEGKVHIVFIVDEFGYLEDPKITRDIGADCGKEALRLVRLMPKWIPGKQNGRPVRTKFTLPVMFVLD